jgi:Uma2 family endonuclease
MSALAGRLDAIDRLPGGSTLVIDDLSWDDYERVVDQLAERHVRVAYDRGRLEITTLSPEHEFYARTIDLLVRAYAEPRHVPVESYGSTTWKRPSLQRGVEPESCYYVASAARIVNKQAHVDLESDPPPDIVVEVDITSDSLDKFGIYAALGVPEVWVYRYTEMRFHELDGQSYREIAVSRFLPGLTPSMLALALAHSKTEGQTAALRAFRQQHGAENPA